MNSQLELDIVFLMQPDIVGACLPDLAQNPKLVLPVPAFNIINGGSHAGNKLAMQVCF
jgi:hypothetical protein